MNQLIVASSDTGEPLTSSAAIADGTENQHKNVLALIRTYLDDFEVFGRVAFETRPMQTAGGAQETTIAMLNEQHATLLITYLRNNELVRGFKMRLVQAFWEARKPKTPQTFAQALRLAAEQAELIEQQQSQIEAARPAVEFKERYVDSSSGAKGFREVCKLLKAKEPAFREFLAEKKVMYRLGIPPTIWPAITYRTLGGEIHVPAQTCCLGLEETPEAFIGHMVEVFRAVRDVLADDGTCWINIGDSYARNPSKGGSGPGGKNGAYSDSYTAAQSARSEFSDYLVEGRGRAKTALSDGTKHKDLLGIPWMLAFALRADGWYLRQDIIWHKPNPMPESVTDRCTKAHEDLFLLAKSPRYFYDHEAIKEDAVGVQSNTGVGWNRTAAADPRDARGMERGRSRRDSFKRDDSKRADVIPAQAVGTHRQDRAESSYDITKRNRRSVWTIATRPYKGAHFAVFPPDLIEPCILAGSRQGDTVLDPFMGSGTTAAVAIEHGRQFIGCELNPEYKPLQDQRIAEAHEAVAAREEERKRLAAQLDMFAGHDDRHLRALSGAETQTINEKATA